MRLRRWMYDRGVLGSTPAGAPVISVGNVTMGGTGKTPMVAWVVARLQHAGHTPAILTRGYKSRDGRSDEAELLERLTGAPVIVNPDRIAGALEAVRNHADVLVMDDGFQHMRLRRELDIVLIDATAPFGRGCCLPLGRLREPLSCLRDADAIVITRSDATGQDTTSALREHLGRVAPRASVHLAAHRPVDVLDGDGASLGAEALSDKDVLIFSGIGNPSAFRATVEAMGGNVREEVRRSDHATYHARDLEEICRRADAGRITCLVTTQKDSVKLSALPLAGRVWQVVVEMHVVEGEAELIGEIRRAARRERLGGPQHGQRERP